MRDLCRLADIGLDQDVCLYDHQLVPPAVSRRRWLSDSQGASSAVGNRPRTLADVRHATGFVGTVLIRH
jgi:hypothetical protein